MKPVNKEAMNKTLHAIVAEACGKVWETHGLEKTTRGLAGRVEDKGCEAYVIYGEDGRALYVTESTDTRTNALQLTYTQKAELTVDKRVVKGFFVDSMRSHNGACLENYARWVYSREQERMPWYLVVTDVDSILKAGSSQDIFFNGMMAQLLKDKAKLLHAGEVEKVQYTKVCKDISSLKEALARVDRYVFANAVTFVIDGGLLYIVDHERGVCGMHDLTNLASLHMGVREATKVAKRHISADALNASLIESTAINLNTLLELKGGDSDIFRTTYQIGKLLDKQDHYFVADVNEIEETVLLSVYRPEEGRVWSSQEVYRPLAIKNLSLFSRISSAVFSAIFNGAPQYYQLILDRFIQGYVGKYAKEEDLLLNIVSRPGIKDGELCFRLGEGKPYRYVKVVSTFALHDLKSFSNASADILSSGSVYFKLELSDKFDKEPLDFSKLKTTKIASGYVDVSCRDESGLDGLFNELKTILDKETSINETLGVSCTYVYFTGFNKLDRSTQSDKHYRFTVECE